MDTLKSKNIEQQLENILNNQIASKDVLTLDETAIYTGFSKSYLYKLTSAGIIPHSKPLGKYLFFDRALLQAWLLSKPVKTSADIEAEAAKYVTLQTGSNRSNKTCRKL